MAPTLAPRFAFRQNGQTLFFARLLHPLLYSLCRHISIRTQDNLSIGGSTARFLGWSASGASLVQEQGVSDTLRKAAIFNSPTAEVKAIYKGRLLSSVPEASSQSGSQRRFARDVTGTQVFYLVYESAGKIWLTYTTNGGTTWQPDRFIDEGKNPAVAVLGYTKRIRLS